MQVQLPHLGDAVIAAIVGALTGWITTIVKLWPEKKKLQFEITQLKAKADLAAEREMEELRKIARERERIELEITQAKAKAERAAEREAEELRKIAREREGIELEITSRRRAEMQAERQEIVQLLNVFSREAFAAPMSSEEPVAMFNALRQTRIWIQTSGALYFRNEDIRNHVREIRRLLANTEREVATKFPIITQLAEEFASTSPNSFGHREHWQRLLGHGYGEAVNMMMQPRYEINRHVREIERHLGASTEPGPADG